MQGDRRRCLLRLDAARKEVVSNSEEFAILPFFAYLAEPERGWSGVLESIDALEEGVAFTWDSSDITPVMERLGVRERRAAGLFIDFFEGRIDRVALGEGLEALGG